MNQFLSRAVALAAGLACATLAHASPYLQTNLVSNLPGVAQIQDTALVNPWGMSFSPTGPFWLSDQGTNVSTLYRVTGGVVAKQALTVTIPTTAGGPQGPTGQVFNNAGAGTFLVGGTAATFIFADLNGTISGWNAAAGTAAAITHTTPGTVYTGLAIAGTGAGARLFAAGSGRIDAFDSAYNPIVTAGGFVNTDPRLAGLVPFNVQTIGSQIYVTYAAPTLAGQRNALEGSGAVAIYDINGNLVKTLVAGSKLASPWGMALAPSTFGAFGGDLLVGNFSFVVPEINAFDPITGAYIGTIGGQDGSIFYNEGLWALAFGNGGGAGRADTLYFTAGIRGETAGLFGSISAIPEPEVLSLMTLGLAGMVALHRRPRTRRERSALAAA